MLNNNNRNLVQASIHLGTLNHEEDLLRRLHGGYSAFRCPRQRPRCHRIVGSSTVYPFATTVAENFGHMTKFKTPKIESTGSGGGLKLFCAGVSVDHPDITNASRRIKASEFDTCRKNGVEDIVEVKFGYDGIAIANSKKTTRLDLTPKDIFLALAKNVPDPKGGDKLVTNPYRAWKEVNPELPDTKIEVLGPPPTSGTRDAFVELAMERGCNEVRLYKGYEEEG